MTKTPTLVGVTCRPFAKSEWADFRSIRLTALQTNPSVFGGSYDKEKEFAQDIWEDWVQSPKSQCFGLFYEGQIIGCTGIVTYRGDETGLTAMMIASFILPQYRGQGLSDLLYRVRIDHAIKHPVWKKIIVGHRVGNEPSRRANQRHVFIYTHTDSKDWPDGTTDEHYNYALDLDALRQKQS